MKYCCDEFVKELGYNGHKGIKSQDGRHILWARDDYGSSRYIIIKFCPFCGSELIKLRFIVQESALDTELRWHVRDTLVGCSVARFSSKDLAHEYVSFKNEILL